MLTDKNAITATNCEKPTEAASPAALAMAMGPPSWSGLSRPVNSLPR